VTSACRALLDHLLAAAPLGVAAAALALRPELPQLAPPAAAEPARSVVASDMLPSTSFAAGHTPHAVRTIVDKPCIVVAAGPSSRKLRPAFHRAHLNLSAAPPRGPPAPPHRERKCDSAGLLARRAAR